MKKIGQGWQYVVYDLGNGRVLKKKYSRLHRFLFIRRDQKRKQILDMAGALCNVYRGYSVRIGKYY